MQPMQLAFYIGRSRENPRTRFWDRVVCLVDGSEYSHVEMVFRKNDDGTYLCGSSSVRDHGVRFKDLDLSPNHWVLVDIEADYNQAWRWMSLRQGRKYDWMGLARTVFSWFPHIERRYFCSEAVAGMLGAEDTARYGLKKLYKWAVETYPQSINPKE